MYLTVSMNPTLQKVICFSSILIDRVNRSVHNRFDAASKGLNVCRVLSQLGKPVVHLTALGGPTRPLYLSMCRKDGLSVEWVESGSPIRFCYTLLDGSTGSVTELIENSETVEAGTEERLLAAYEKLLADCETVVISGTKAPGFSDELIPFMVRRAKDKNCRVVLEVWGKDLVGSLPFKPDVIKPNLLEYAATFAPHLVHEGEVPDNAGTKEAVDKICGELWAEYRCDIVLTRGMRPVWFVSGGVPGEAPVIPASKAVNTTGSGDAFTAGLVSALDLGLKDAITEAGRCGALNAGLLQVGTIIG
jgi:fructose-1-phosphate kinase PfkB-like protein